MKTKVLAVTFMATLILNVHGQSATQPANAAGAASQGKPQALPPGLQGQQQLPPASSRPELRPPPGLGSVSNVFGTGTNRFGVGTNQFGGVTNQFGFGTNQFGIFSHQFGVGTNQFLIITNEFGLITNPLLNQSNGFATTGLPETFTPAGTRTNFVMRTNGVLSTNAVGRFTNFPPTAMQDRAITATDRTLLVQIHRSLRGAFPQATVFVPIHFIVKDRVVSIVGFVRTPDEKARLLATVQNVPGIVQVVDQLQINPQPGAAVFGSSTAQMTNQFGIVTTNTGAGFLITNLTPTSESNAANRIFSAPSGQSAPLAPSSAPEPRTNATPQQ